MTRTVKEIGKQAYEVDCKKGNVTYIPRNKEEKKQLLRQIVFLKLRDRWMKIPEKLATLERQTIRELIDSI